MFAFIITTTEKQFIAFGEDETEASNKFKSSTGRKIVNIKKIEDYNEIYEIDY